MNAYIGARTSGGRDDLRGLLSRVAHPLFASVFFFIPLVLIYEFASRGIPVSPPATVIFSTVANKDALQIIIACTQILVTISLSTVAAGGLLIMKAGKGHPIICSIFGLIAFCATAFSVYYAITIFKSSSFIIAAGVLDIRPIDGLLGSQATYALIAASALGGLIVGARE